MLNLHRVDHPRISRIALVCVIASGQFLIEGSSRIFFNALHHPAKFGIGVGIIHISDRYCDPRIVPNILVYLAIRGMREFEILPILDKPHGRRLWRPIGSNGRHIGKLLGMQDFLDFRMLHIYH